MVPNVVITNREQIPKPNKEGPSTIKRPDDSCPPNITVTPETSLPPHVLQEMFQQPRGTSHQDNFGGFVKVPIRRKDARTRKSGVEVKSSEPKMSSFENVLSWMEKNDTNMTEYDNCYMQNTISELLDKPEIVNNQSSSFTKSVYALKGFTRDFADLRKSKIELTDLSQELSKLNAEGEQISVQKLSDFENLLLPLNDVIEV